MRFAAIVFLCLSSFKIHGQELARNLVYANKNLIFEDVMVVGKHKLLRITPAQRQNNRFVYLLDEQNIVVDTLKILGNDRFLIHNDSSFSIKGLGEYVKVKISNSKLVTTAGYKVKYSFEEKVFSPLFMLNNNLFGSKWDGKNAISTYHSAPFTAIKSNVITSNKIQEYNIFQLDTLLLFDGSTYFLNGSNFIPPDKLLKPLIDSDSKANKALKSPYYGWNSYSVLDNEFVMYEKKRGTIFKFDSQKNFEVISKLELPKEDSSSFGWKYLFDYSKKKHYAVRRKTEKTEGNDLKKRKKNSKRKTSEYEYTLYEVDLNGNKIKPMFRLGFDPKMIDNDLIYEIVQESKKGSALYFHPIDPNYKYEKSTLVNY